MDEYIILFIIVMLLIFVAVNLYRSDSIGSILLNLFLLALASYVVVYEF